jgi:DNA-directed RNA polymerase specialized sigma subunit
MKKLKKPVEQLRVELVADPATQSIAKKLGLPVEEYVEKVLDYAQHPDKQPQLNLIPDGVAKSQGGATTADVVKWFNDVAARKIDVRDDRQKARDDREKDAFEAKKPAKKHKKKS